MNEEPAEDNGLTVNEETPPQPVSDESQTPSPWARRSDGNDEWLTAGHEEEAQASAPTVSTPTAAEMPLTENHAEPESQGAEHAFRPGPNVKAASRTQDALTVAYSSSSNDTVSAIEATAAASASVPSQHRGGKVYRLAEHVIIVGIAASVVCALILFNGAGQAERTSSNGGYYTPVNVTSAKSDTSANPSTADVSNDWREASRAALNATVSIRSSSSSSSSSGSGVILNKEGYIITNDHVVGDASQSSTEIQVTLNDLSVYSAELVKGDSNTDLALLKMVHPPSNLMPITFADSDQLSIGDPVMAVGSPLGLSGTVTTGIVSALDRPVSARGTSSRRPAVINAVQVSAPINPGNSGGSLVNLKGELIGINSSIATSGGSTGNIGIGFAIPSNTVKDTLAYLQQEKAFPGGRLGVLAAASYARDGVKTILGAMIRQVTADGPAGKAGLRAGDLIVSLDGRRVSSQESLVATVNTIPEGTSVKLEYLRDGSRRTVQMKLGSRSE